MFLILFLSVPELNDIQDAYVVAVEDKARQRLEALTALHKVKAVDISQAQSNDVNHTAVNGHADQPPVYIATTKLESQIEVPEKKAPLESVEDLRSSECECSESEKEEVDGTNGTMEMGVMNGYVNGHSSGPHTQETDLRFHGSNGMIDSNMANYGGSYVPAQDYENDEDSDMDGPHREMAIDCPPSFVGSKKERPSYPPAYRSSPKSKRHGYVPRTEEVGASAVPDMSAAEQQAQMERIKRYQEDLRKRKEEEARIAQEEEFLRTSLRGSKKLQALEEANKASARVPPPTTGIINPTYIVEEADPENLDVARAATLPIREGRRDGWITKPIGKWRWL